MSNKNDKMINTKNITRIIEVSHYEIDGFSDSILKDYGYNSSSNNPDIIIIRTEEKEKIGISQIKELRTWAYIKPFQLDRKITIIERADLMTKEAQNSILKITEEPPSFLYIFLIVENHTNLLETIISRSELTQIRSQHVNSNDVTKELFTMTLSERFLFVDNLAKKKTPEISNFLNEVITTLRESGYREESAQVLQYKISIMANVSKKLILDNLVLLFEKMQNRKSLVA